MNCNDDNDCWGLGEGVERGRGRSVVPYRKIDREFVSCSFRAREGACEARLRYVRSARRVPPYSSAQKIDHLLMIRKLIRN